MKRILSVLAVTLVAVSVALGDDKPKKPRGLAGVDLTQAQVDAAIDKGVQFLLDKVEKDPESLSGQSGDGALTVYALASAGAFDKRAELAKRCVGELYKRPVGHTYETAVTILALEHLGGRLHAPRIADCVQSLLDLQGNDEASGWGYGEDKESAPRAVPDVGPAAVIEVTGGLPLRGATPVASLKKTGEAGSDGDHSTTQFAVLGLHAAAAAGVVAPKEVWERAVKHYANSQNEDGGWCYTGTGEPSYQAMTCAGLSGLAMALHHSGAKDPLADPRLAKGVAWLGKNLSFEKSAGKDNGLDHLYYAIYGIERVGILLGTEFLGDHEWFPEGAKHLLGKQRADGAWANDEGNEGELHATCFALLFLTKATRAIAAPKGGSGTLRTAVAGEVAAARDATGLYFILDASGSMQEKIGARTKWEIVREAAKKIVAKLPDDALVGLRVYGHNPSNPKKVDERETELLIPVGKLDRARFEKVVDGIKPIGRTPIAMSFDRCWADLGAGPPCRVLLLSDGAETGGGDPVASARTLAGSTKCLGIDCLGFDLASEPKARAQLQEIAKVGKGRYTESEDPDVLGRAGARASAEYLLLDAKGAEVARGTLGDARPLPEGEYRIRVTVGDKPYEAPVWINTGIETKATVYPARARS